MRNHLRRILKNNLDMEKEYWETLDEEWQKLLYINFIFETTIDEKQKGKYNFWTTPFENYENLFGDTKLDSKLNSGKIIENLTKVDVYGTKITDIKPLEYLNNLKEFYCGSTNIMNLNSLSKTPNLEKLCCYNTSVVDITPLVGLLKLKRLCVSKSNISDISPLKYLVKLQKLSIYKTNVFDLSPLTEHVSLVKLNISFTPVAKLKALYNLHNLRELHCYQTKASAFEIQQVKMNLPNCNVINDYEVPETEYDDFA